MGKKNDNEAQKDSTSASADAGSNVPGTPVQAVLSEAGATVGYIFRCVGKGRVDANGKTIEFIPEDGETLDPEHLEILQRVTAKIREKAGFLHYGKSAPHIVAEPPYSRDDLTAVGNTIGQISDGELYFSIDAEYLSHRLPAFGLEDLLKRYAPENLPNEA
ncbi:hypothetical protein A2706_02195 [Candidatus Peribacteria bacterium RIFCSPHIGHO2_01_FULL_51_35]|nr:MAG: hypothetical protein A2706_02195 [Candidatus Peribacteria bacterium RIFCSPHIGHO2_01_FULL_51_35]